MAAVAFRTLPVQKIFVDASVKEGRVGIGLNHETLRMVENYRVVNMQKHRADSNQGELAAIFVAMLDMQRSHIYTDSQTAINLIRRGTLDPRFHSLVSCSRWMMQRNQELRLLKCKGHAGVPGNELADKLAAAGRSSGRDVVLPDVLMQGRLLRRDNMIADVIDECLQVNQWRFEDATIWHNCRK